MVKGQYRTLAGTAFLLTFTLNIQSAVSGSCYKHGEQFKTQLMNKAASRFNQVDKDQDIKISREEHDHSSLSSYGVPFEKFDVDKDQYISWEEYKNQMEDSHNVGGKKV